VRARGVKTGLGLVALLLPGGLLFLLGWVLVRALARARARVRAEAGTPDSGAPMGHVWQVWQVLLQEARAVL
jgi:hypothetical protein